MRPLEKCSAKSWLLLDLAVCFMFCVFAPLEAYFSNESEYWFHLSHLLPVVLCVFAAAFSTLTLFSAAIWRTKLNGVVYSLLLVFLIFSYIQGNYIPRPYGVLNGAEIDWSAEKFKPLGYASIALLVTALCVWCLVVALRPLRDRIFDFGRGLCLVLCGLQIVTLVTLYLQNNVFEDNSSPTIQMTTDKWLDLSPTNNVLVILLDTFDGRDMTSILDGTEGDFVRETLRDFTFYPDTLGLYPTTKGAVPHILTGRIYTNEIPFSEYLVKAYGDPPLYKEMARKDYSVCAYSDLRFMSRSVRVFENVYPGTSRISNKLHFARTLYSLVAFNYLPHQLKRHFVVPDDAFMALRKSLSKAIPYSESMSKFYKALKDGNVNLTDKKNAFRFYHTRGVHPPLRFGKDLVRHNDIKFSYHDASLGCITLLRLFFRRLEEAGIYDASTIIVMADHGHVRYGQNPLFLVKNRGERHVFRISNVPMSFCYFPDLMMNLVRDGTSITEESIAAFSKPGESRYFLSYRWDNSWKRRYLPLIHEMRLDGNAALSPGSVFEKTGRQFGGQVQSDEEIKERTLSFAGVDGAPARKICHQGVARPDKEFTWTTGDELTMRFSINPQRTVPFSVTLRYGTLLPKERIIVSANGRKIDKYVAKGEEQRKFVIPPSCFSDDGTVTLTFSFPDAISPKKLGWGGDNRKLALRLYSVVMK